MLEFLHAIENHASAFLALGLGLYVACTYWCAFCPDEAVRESMRRDMATGLDVWTWMPLVVLAVALLCISGGFYKFSAVLIAMAINSQLQVVLVKANWFGTYRTNYVR